MTALHNNSFNASQANSCPPNSSFNFVWPVWHFKHMVPSPTPRLGVVMQPPTHVFQPHCPLHEQVDDIAILRGRKASSGGVNFCSGSPGQVLKWQRRP
eukprot:5493710-Pyramimonas_sp.AAC.1